LWTKEVEELVNHSKLAEDDAKKRRQKLLSERDLTASIIVEMLFTRGTLDEEAYRLVESTRRARNNLVHKAKSVSNSESGLALAAAGLLLRKLSAVDLAFSGATTMSYAVVEFKTIE